VFPEGEEEDEDEVAGAALRKKSDASFQALADWYGNQYPTADNPPRPPLVLVIQVSI